MIYDVVVVGAGLSGIGAAYYLKKNCPNYSFTVLESRAAIGGTWDLFKYPGIRSDSDMYTFGFSFYPWKNPKAIADGPAILSYINETADAFGIRDHIQFQSRVIAANWLSEIGQWELTIAQNEKKTKIHTRFLFMCSGYYNYAQGYLPKFKDTDVFKGRLIHPQHWDPQLNYENKKIIIIGSGATAVTLLPELAKKAQKVTLLQRSPTFIMAAPSKDKWAELIKKILPKNTAHQLVRWKNILLGMGFYQLSKRWPNWMKKQLIKGVKKQLGEAFDAQHFTPAYNPWDQRLCLVPDADFFKALKTKKAQIVTQTIDRFLENGILLSDGSMLEADIIVTATGLNVQLFGGMDFKKDGQAIDTASLKAYKGVMLSEVPNFALSVGYTNASWTLKCDLNCQFVTKVLNHMQKDGYQFCTPRFDEEKMQVEELLDFDAGYVLRARHLLPKQGNAAPWKVYQNYIKDLKALKYDSITDVYLEYR